MQNVPVAVYVAAFVVGYLVLAVELRVLLWRLVRYWKGADPRFRAWQFHLAVGLLVAGFIAVAARNVGLLGIALVAVPALGLFGILIATGVAFFRLLQRFKRWQPAVASRLPYLLLPGVGITAMLPPPPDEVILLLVFPGVSLLGQRRERF